MNTKYIKNNRNENLTGICQHSCQNISVMDILFTKEKFELVCFFSMNTYQWYAKQDILWLH